MGNSDLMHLRRCEGTSSGQPIRVRDAVRFSYKHGFTLLDFVFAQNKHRSVQQTYVNRLGSYQTAAAELGLAVGREALQ